MLIVGEKINGTRKEVREGIVARDVNFVQDLARSQVDAGANYLDVNAGTNPDREPEDLVWLVETVQAAVAVPLCLDSANPRALAAAIPTAGQTPMINSISGEPSRLGQILPLAARHGCRIIALALDDQGIPKDVDGRMAVVRQLLAATRAAGMADESVYVDPLVMAIATDNQSGAVTLETMERVRAEYPEAHLTGGLSNASFGLPARSLVNQAFLTLALGAGMDSAIMDPTDRALCGALLAAEVVLGRDRHCLTYNRAFRAGKIGKLS